MPVESQKSSQRSIPLLKPKSLAGLKRTNTGFKSEDRVVKDLGMKGTSGSGNQIGSKSDGYDHEYRIECKSTIAASMVVHHDWLLKIVQEALETGKVPLLSISFTYVSGKPVPNGDWICMQKSHFKELTERD